MKPEARLRLRKPPPEIAVMPFVNGKSFHCHCGANVFTKKIDIYQCNGCGELYQ